MLIYSEKKHFNQLKMCACFKEFLSSKEKLTSNVNFYNSTLEEQSMT